MLSTLFGLQFNGLSNTLNFETRMTNVHSTLFSEGDAVYETSKEDPETPNTTETDSPTPSYDVLFKRGRKRVADDFFERTIANYMSKKYVEKPGNPDFEFFKSILSDMTGFSDSQKRRFKIQVLQLLEDISSAFSAHSSSTDSFQQAPETHDVIGE